MKITNPAHPYAVLHLTGDDEGGAEVRFAAFKPGRSRTLVKGAVYFKGVGNAQGSPVRISWTHIDRVDSHEDAPDAVRSAAIEVARNIVQAAMTPAILKRARGEFFYFAAQRAEGDAIELRKQAEAQDAKALELLAKAAEFGVVPAVVCDCGIGGDAHSGDCAVMR